jgi:hypothetical protein
MSSLFLLFAHCPLSSAIPVVALGPLHECIRPRLELSPHIWIVPQEFRKFGMIFDEPTIVDEVRVVFQPFSSPRMRIQEPVKLPHIRARVQVTLPGHDSIRIFPQLLANPRMISQEFFEPLMSCNPTPVIHQ